MGKSLEEIWENMQKELESRRESKIAKEKELLEISERQRKEYLKRNLIYESLSNANAISTSSAGGGTPTIEFISIVDTIWLYPQVDLDYVTGIAPGLSISFTKSENTYTFETFLDLTNFYDQLFISTEVNQPIGNVGYSLGVGTITRSRRNQKLYFRLESGITVAEFHLMTQITDQSDLPSGGDSPNGTIGWGLTYCDWNLDGIADTTGDPFPPSTYCDPLRFRLNS
ncbi:MAG: hypothetical protein ACOVNU_02685 [Candidatus Kapaibacteriota bacterium]